MSISSLSSIASGGAASSIPASSALMSSVPLSKSENDKRTNEILTNLIKQKDSELAAIRVTESQLRTRFSAIVDEKATFVAQLEQAKKKIVSCTEALKNASTQLTQNETTQKENQSLMSRSLVDLLASAESIEPLFSQLKTSIQMTVKARAQVAEINNTLTQTQSEIGQLEENIRLLDNELPTIQNNFKTTTDKIAVLVTEVEAFRFVLQHPEPLFKKEIIGHKRSASALEPALSSSHAEANNKERAYGAKVDRENHEDQRSSKRHHSSSASASGAAAAAVSPSSSSSSAAANPDNLILSPFNLQIIASEQFPGNLFHLAASIPASDSGQTIQLFNRAFEDNLKGQSIKNFLDTESRQNYTLIQFLAAECRSIKFFIKFLQTYQPDLSKKLTKNNWSLLQIISYNKHFNSSDQKLIKELILLLTLGHDKEGISQKSDKVIKQALDTQPTAYEIATIRLNESTASVLKKLTEEINARMDSDRKQRSEDRESSSRHRSSSRDYERDSYERDRSHRRHHSSSSSSSSSSRSHSHYSSSSETYKKSSHK